MKPVIRCSSLDRLLSCPGSFTLEALESDRLDIFAGPSGNEMTWRGNWCHHQAALRLVKQHGAIPPPNGLPPPVLPKLWQPSPWDERTVSWYLSHLLTKIPDDHAIYVERHATLEFERFILSGHIDEYDINPEGTVFNLNDLKTGVSIVDIADENWQLLGYIVLLKSLHPRLKSGTARIFQPMADDPITEGEVHDIDAVVGYLEEKINTALDNLHTLQTGYKQCRLCPAALYCPAIKEEIAAMKLTLTPETIASIKTDLPTPELAKLATAARTLKGPIDKIMESFKERVTAEGSVTLEDGTVAQIVDTPGDRVIANTQVAFEFAKNKVGEDAAWRSTKISLTKLEDELVETGMKRTSKKSESAQSWIRDNLGHLITRPTQKTLRFS
ncbi:MAG: DUF2800 domain-containing protein [Opitutaceae bacterium]|nr:DUF2800 domain-containing protein [Opitutaceae bacterium]